MCCLFGEVPGANGWWRRAEYRSRVLQCLKRGDSRLQAPVELMLRLADQPAVFWKRYRLVRRCKTIWKCPLFVSQT